MQNQDGLYSQAWKLFTQDKSWIKTLAILSLIGLIPIVGFLVILGYVAEWGCMLCWKKDMAFVRPIAFKKYLRLGWIAVVPTIAGGIAWSLVDYILLKPITAVVPILDIVVIVLSILWSVAVLLCAMRAVVYQDIFAAFNLGFVKDMIMRETHGFLSLAFVQWLIGIVVGIIIIVITLICAAPVMASIIGLVMRSYGYGASAMNQADTMKFVGGFLSFFANSILFILIGCYVAGFPFIAGEALSWGVLGIWMRRFDVERWGDKGDTLPDDMDAFVGISEGVHDAVEDCLDNNSNCNENHPAACNSNGVDNADNADSAHCADSIGSADSSDSSSDNNATDNGASD